VLANATGESVEELSSKLSLDSDAVHAVVKRIPKGPHQALVKAELDAVADKTFTPRVWAKEVR
jgi:hypothetical protein